MEKHSKVNIFLAVVVLLAIIAIFAFGGSNQEQPVSTKEHEEHIQMLKSTIAQLEKDIAYYEQEVARIGLEKETLRKEFEQIIKDNEKTDANLANGDWDDNIRFLTEYLSEKDSLGK